MKNFITNSGAANLKKRLIELIKKSDELKFLVGFFYFSGIRELYEGLKEKPDVALKVLVGLNVDKATFGLTEFGDNESHLSDEERTYRFFRSIEKSLNSEDFDTEEFYEQVKYFIKLIQDDKLIIRKTYKPNHAKVYIFKLEEGQVARQSLFITGSSNLTRPGLTTQEEFNVEISDFGVEDAEAYFDALWEEAVKITEDDLSKSKLIEVVENKTLIKEITPFEAFILVLKTYLDSFDKKDIGQSLIKVLEENGYTPYKYQLEAVEQALAIIDKNNGVIIADVVGLGKTIIACAVAREAKKRGMVICPPGLIGNKDKSSGWQRYLEEFGLAKEGWEARSLGDLEGITEFLKRVKDVEVIIIDEAHRFRNQDTKDYELLKNICRGKTVILLTATPFNNRPRDILSLLKLFIVPKKSSITLENNLVDRFKAFGGIFDRLGFIKKYHNSPNAGKKAKAQSYYQALFGESIINLAKIKERSKYLAKQIRDVIEPVTIRRNRLDLQNNPFYKDEVKDLSKVQPPQEWFFELTEEQSSFYDNVITDYFGDPEEGGQFRGAIYKPYEYATGKKISEEGKEKEENKEFLIQKNLYDFMRRLLVKRFESSFGSFEQSIKNFKRVTENVLEFIEKTGKYILDRSLLEKIHDLDMEEIERHLSEYAEKIRNGDYPKSHKIYELEKFDDKEGFLEDIRADLKLFGGILKELADLDLVKEDPKTACLIQHVKEVLAARPKKDEPRRKIVIFSEYADTTKYLEPELKKNFAGRVLTIAGDLSSAKITHINKDFDASFQDQKNEFDILLATDKISEGFNLNRAGIVINYDIPWNPVRVIQRLGRINRISKKVFDDLFIVNFFPTEKGSELVKSREIASNKMFLIHNTLGEDAQIFDIEEEPTPAGLYERIQRNPDEMEQESFYTKALKEYLKIQKENPDLIEKLKHCPPRVKVAKAYKENELLVFLKKGRLYIHGVKYEGEEPGQAYQSTFEDAFDHIVCTVDEQRLALSDAFWTAYEGIKKFKDNRIIPPSEFSLEQKAINNLKTLIDKIHFEQLMPHKDFLRTLLEDILDYGTLSDYTLRRIANFEHGDKRKEKAMVDEIVSLRKELGDDYLEREKNSQRNLSQEVIIAIENRKA